MLAQSVDASTHHNVEFDFDGLGEFARETKMARFCNARLKAGVT
jgi:hypothetical protein